VIHVQFTEASSAISHPAPARMILSNIVFYFESSKLALALETLVSPPETNLEGRNSRPTSGRITAQKQAVFQTSGPK
jgi:hypothetical protein